MLDEFQRLETCPTAAILAPAAFSKIMPGHPKSHGYTPATLIRAEDVPEEDLDKYDSFREDTNVHALREDISELRNREEDSGDNFETML